MDLTVLELQFPNAEFNAPYSNPAQKSTTDTPQSDQNQSHPGIFPLIFLLIIAGIAAIGYVLRNRND